MTEGKPHYAPVELEPSESPMIMGPLVAEAEMSGLSLFGPEKLDLDLHVGNAMNHTWISGTKPDIADITSIDDKSRGNGSFAEKCNAVNLAVEADGVNNHSAKADEFIEPPMLPRAKEKYLFDFQKNQQILSDQPSLRDAWAWVAGELNTQSLHQ
jgi:WD repeat-containing protein mio